MVWQKVCPIDDLKVGETQKVEVADEFVLLCRVSEREVFAIEDMCSHDDGPLGEGVLDGETIECPRHGARFDVRTGSVVRMPAPTPLNTFAVRLNQEGWIEVALEDLE
jgi:3-phenylpropionate/trans-cinnamate dioxygenase ferredoxin subunit